jgi:hypothetical protein
MPYACKVFSSIHQVPAQDWTIVCGPLAFLFGSALSRGVGTLGDQSQLWYVVIYDEDSNPSACSVLCILGGSADPGWEDG